jgi:hypothetical protein
MRRADQHDRGRQYRRPRRRREDPGSATDCRQAQYLQHFEPGAGGSAIADADGLLTGFTGKMSYGVKTTSAIGTNMFGDANTLGNYDDGSLTPGCTP